jgi:hypothetical protein
MQKQEFVDMGVAPVATGASLRYPVNWHSINWKKVHRNVRRLQTRIVKLDNLVLLHVNCHRQAHSQGWKVSKPRPVKRAFAGLEPDEGKLSRPVL